MMKKLESNTLFHHLTPRAKIEKDNKKTTLQRENPLSKYDNCLCTAKIVQIGVLMSIISSTKNKSLNWVDRFAARKLSF
jgi:hypothetical protein